jgi:hypothetical protein
LPKKLLKKLVKTKALKRSKREKQTSYLLLKNEKSGLLAQAGFYFRPYRSARGNYFLMIYFQDMRLTRGGLNGSLSFQFQRCAND